MSPIFLIRVCRTLCLLLTLTSLARAAAPDPENKQSGHPAFALIQESYARSVQPIFERKCYDCHSAHPRLPSYYSFFLAKWLIDSDIAEARENVDFTPGFPFASKGKPSDDLRKIAHEIEEGDMPTFLYRLMHSGSALTPEEKKLTLAWTQESLARLGSPAAPPAAR